MAIKVIGSLKMEHLKERRFIFLPFGFALAFPFFFFSVSEPEFFGEDLRLVSEPLDAFAFNLLSCR